MKNWLRISIIGIIAIVAVLLFTSLAAFKSERDQRISLENLSKDQESKIKVFQDKEKAWHTTSDVAEVRNIEALRLISKYDKRFADLDQRFESVNKNLKNLQYLGISSMSSNYDIKSPGAKDTLVVFNKDTIPATITNYTDSSRWYSFHALIYNNKVHNLQFATKDSIETVVTWRRKWFLGRKHFSQEIKSLNPHTKVGYARSIMVTKKR